MLRLGLLSGLIFTLFSVAQAQSTIDIQGHRGARGLMPENTIPAFIKALELGVTTLELDVVISQDSQVVVSHEPFLSHTICTDPDGETISAAEEKRYNLYQMNYDEIRRADCGSQGNPRFPEQQRISVSKPLLVNVIDSVEQYLRENNRPPVQYNIETKSSPDGDGVFHPAPTKFVSLLLDVIRKKDIADRTVIQSFDVRTLQEAQQMAPEIRQALLVENHRGVQQNIAELGYTPTIYSPYYKLVDKELRAYTRGNGMLLIPWTVNKPKAVRKMLRIGVDGIISDYPNRVVEIVGS